MSSPTKGSMGDVESEIIDVMRKEDYSLDVTNNYGDNLLHLCAANGWNDVIKKILQKHENSDVITKSDRGWTPLVEAIINGDIATVKLLFANDCTAEQPSFQGISGITLAAAVGQEMFDIVYKACPLALERSKSDYISPLYVACLKKDRGLLNKLQELGYDISENRYCKYFPLDLPKNMSSSRKIEEHTKECDCSTDTVNECDNNLSHSTNATNYCNEFIKELLNTHVNRAINKRNDCGWTPLMQAIRNGNVETVKLLLANGCNPDESNFEGLSVIGLAAAISQEMFEIVYDACPWVVEHSNNDNIGPLCVAAMKNDKRLFFRMLDLGLDPSVVNEFTHRMMRQSSVPEIAQLADPHSESDEYSKEQSSFDHCIDISEDEFEVPQMSSTLHSFDHEDSKNDSSEIPSIRVSPPDDKKVGGQKHVHPSRTRFTRGHEKIASKSLISPRLEYTREQAFPQSPNVFFVRRENGIDGDFVIGDKHHCVETDKDKNYENVDFSKKFVPSSEGNKLYKYQMNRPPNLQIPRDENFKVWEDGENSKTPLSSNKTPTEPRFDTPPGGITLDIHQKKMALVLKRFGLTHFIPTFLEQEIDLDLFLSLNDQDLQEIGIEKKSDRIILLSVVDECNRNRMFMI